MAAVSTETQVNPSVTKTEAGYYILRGRIPILTGPIIVACQWNTERQKKIQQLEIFWAFPELKCTECSRKSLQSSPTGPAEQWAGGSRCRSLSSCKKHRNISKTWKSILLGSIPSKVGTQTNFIKPRGTFCGVLIKQPTLEMSIETEKAFLPDGLQLTVC